MKLIKIEVQGFKSFAEKIEIQFKDGITAIVGPNGSGKSNISDAIRWVLGEQSVKTLRGSRMEDVIFAGTGKRKPLGYTEVTITFDNKSGNIPIDYEEVAVTRRMFRSGESEYYLNKNSCRLRDVRELFMDTGVGKDGYSIVGQGRIDEILSNRPEDRRSIFEEAAGIVKYKSKKEEAEKKLEKTEDNLVRIKDLIYELSSQSELLEEQSNKAQRFSKLFNRLKELEVNIFLKDIKDGKKEIKQLNFEKDNLDAKLQSKLENKKSIEEKFNLLKTNTEKSDLKIEEYRNMEMHTINESDKNKHKISLLEEKKNFNLRELERIEKEKEILEKKLKTLTQASVDRQEDIGKYKQEYSALLGEYESELKKLEQKQEKIKGIEEAIDLEKDNIIKIYNKSSDKKSKLNSINSFNDNIGKRTIQLNKEIDEMILQKELSGKVYEELTSKEINFKKEISTLKDKYNKLEQIEGDIVQKEDLINKEINSKNIKLQGKISSLKLFENMEASYEGYYRGVKSILRAAKSNSRIRAGLVGVVAELIKVDEKFEKAIETALGSNAQNIVTKTEEDAKIIIEYLKDNKLGRITCLPLNVVRGNTLKFSQRERKDFHILGLGSEIIDYDEKHDGIFKSLLGRTIIVENLDYGIKLANRYNHSYRIVTLSGEILNPGGSMTGGSYASNSVSIINRKNRIDKLGKEIEEYKEDHSNLLKDKDNIINNLKATREGLKEYEKSIRNLEYEIINTKNNKENQNLEYKRLDQSIKKSQKEIKTLNHEVDNYNVEKDKLKDSILDLENKSKALKIEIENSTTILNEEKALSEEMNKVVIDMKIELNKKENEIQNSQEKLNKDKLEIEDIKLELQEKTKSILLNGEKMKSMEESRVELSKVIEELDKLKIDIKKKLDGSIEAKKKLMESFYRQQDNLKVVNEEIGNMEKIKNSQQVKLAKISVQLENYYKRLQDDYELTYEEALEQEVEIENIQKAIIETRKLKMEIKEIGTVNLSSIEEYKKLKTRLSFILEQENDLTTAKEDLREVIRDMEEKMKKQFICSFEEINKNFQEVFGILFDGGKAELFLEDKEDILNTGIEIKAQPPGKRLQSLSLLSGGEKSLTAVALLFSILKMKPAPFCVLDEIDAALDEANIGRYTNYLKNYCQDTQFIIITHRKATMEMADVLYGVTMEEEGISKLISVELTDDIDEIAS